MSETRKELFDEMIDSIDRSYALMLEYDSIPHNYGGRNYLYQSESRVINIIGDNPQITAKQMSKMIRKTSSFCSQAVAKLREKGFVEQIRNERNAREYFLVLTDSGRELYEDHKRFEQECLARTFRSIGDFSETELETFVAILDRINETFELDIDASKMKVTELHGGTR